MYPFSANTPLSLLLASHRKDQEAQEDHRSRTERDVLHLFDGMGSRLYGYAIGFGISAQDGEDVVQETFLALFQHLLRERSSANLQAWLYRVTHNLALKRRMRNRADGLAPEASPGEPVDHGPGPEECLLFDERYALLQSALHALPPVDQSCLRLRNEGLRYREISKILGISLGSVAASLARSLARLERAERR